MTRSQSTRSDLAGAAPDLALLVPEALLERIASRVAELLSDQDQPAHTPAAGASPYLSVPEAAELLRAKPQRVYDLLSAGRLTRYKDGSRVLVSRAEIDAHLAGQLAFPLARRSPRG